jgi:hypothetical protein
MPMSCRTGAAFACALSIPEAGRHPDRALRSNQRRRYEHKTVFVVSCAIFFVSFDKDHRWMRTLLKRKGAGLSFSNKVTTGLSGYCS